MASAASVENLASALSGLLLTSGGELALVADPATQATSAAAAVATTGDSTAEATSEAIAFDELNVQVGLDFNLLAGSSEAASSLLFVAASSRVSAEAATGDATASATTNALGLSSGTWQIGRDLRFAGQSLNASGPVPAPIKADADLSAKSVTGDADATSAIELAGLEGLQPTPGSPLVGRDARVALLLEGHQLIASEAISGNASTDADLDVQGIEDSLLSVGGDLDLSLILDVEHRGLAETQTGNATNTLNLDLQGIEDVPDPLPQHATPPNIPEWEIGGTADLSAIALVRSLTQAAAGSGDAEATAELDLQAFEDFSLAVGGDLGLRSNLVTLQSETSAFSVTGNATAEGTADIQGLEGDSGDPISLSSGGDTRLSFDIRGFSVRRNVNGAEARTTAGDAAATANSEGLAGVAKANVLAGEELGVSAVAQLLTQASASTVSAGDATAEAVLGERLASSPTNAEKLASLDAVGAIVGTNNTAASGTDLQLLGVLGSIASPSLPNRTIAQAENVSGAATAIAAMPTAFAVKLASISAGDDATLLGFNSAVVDAMASTTNGDSQADVFVTRSAGVEVLGAAGQVPAASPASPALRIGLDGSLVGKASLVAGAQASTVTASGAAPASVRASVGAENTSDALTVVGVQLPSGGDSAQVGGNLRLFTSPFTQQGLLADAVLTQAAQAGAVTGDVEAVLGDTQATQIIGLTGDLEVGRDLSSARLAALSNHQAIATTVLGQVEARSDSETFAFNGSQMVVGGTMALSLTASSSTIVQSSAITEA